MYKKTHQLRWPFQNDNDETVRRVTISAITVGHHRKMVQAHEKRQSTGMSEEDSNRQLLRECVCVSTGLSNAEVKRLTRPDYNQIEKMVLSLLTQPAVDFIQTPDEAENPDDNALLIPFSGATGEMITGYTMYPPTVETTDIMDSHKDKWEKTIFISATCTGLSPAELDRMYLPDWNQLQEQLINFLNEDADFFHQQMSAN